MKLPIPWRRAGRGQQSTADVAHLSEAGAQSRAGDSASLGRYVRQWADVVLRFSNTDLLTGHQNTLVFGAKAMGRQAVMLRIAELVNARFSAEHHAGVYVDLQHMVSASTVYTWTSVDGVYHDLISAALTWLQVHLHVKPDRELQKVETQLAALLDVPVAKLDMLAVRNAFYGWLDRAGIQTLSFVIDDVSSLAPEFIPILLQMLLDTFPRGSRVSFKLGGEKQSLKLEERAKQGAQRAALGMQFSHDILVGLDLEHMLQASDLAPSSFDPRQVFLLDCIQKLAPNAAARVQPQPDPVWDALFDPAQAWFDVFKMGDFDIELVGAALENLLPALAGAELTPVKADAAQVEQAVARAKVQAGLRKTGAADAQP